MWLFVPGSWRIGRGAANARFQCCNIETRRSGVARWLKLSNASFSNDATMERWRFGHV
jgi:hypothetical protein